MTTKLEAFVSRGGVDVSKQVLVQQGPVDCCDAPSGGFSYTGKTTFDVKAGDVYGFRVSGSNYTGGPVMRGTLALQEVDATAPVVTPVVTGTQLGGDFYTGPGRRQVGHRRRPTPGSCAKTGCDDVTVTGHGRQDGHLHGHLARRHDDALASRSSATPTRPSLTVPSAVVKQADGPTAPP